MSECGPVTFMHETILFSPKMKQHRIPSYVLGRCYYPWVLATSEWEPCGYLGLVGIECKFGDPFCCHWGLRKSIQALLTLLWGSGQGLAVTRLITLGLNGTGVGMVRRRKLCFACSIPYMCFAYSKWDLSRPCLHTLHTWMTPVNLPTRGRGRKRTPLRDNDLSLSNSL